MWFFFNTAKNEFEKQDEETEKDYEVITEEKTEEQESKSDCKQDCEEDDLILMKLKNVEARMLELEYKIDDIVTLLHEQQRKCESPDTYKDCYNFYDPIPTLEKETQTELDRFLEETLQINLGNELIIGKKNFSKSNSGLRSGLGISLDKTEIANDIAEKPLILQCFDKVEQKQKKKKESKTQKKPKPKVPTRIRKSKRVINKNLKDKESNTIINTKIWKT